MKNLKDLSNSLNDYSFSRKIPSTGEEVTGKFYTIRDEFKLAQLNTFQNKKSMMKELYNILADKYYTMTKEQLKNLTTADVQYLLAQLKIESDETSVEINIKCSKCKKDFTYTMDLTKLKVNSTPRTKTFYINEDDPENVIGITFKILSFNDIISDFDEENVDGDNLASTGMEILYKSVESITVGNSKIDNFTDEDLKDFIDNIPKKYSIEFQEFLSKPPEIFYDSKIICTTKECGHKIDLDATDFFPFLF